MMGQKKLSEIKAEVVALLKRHSGGSPKEWLDRQIELAKNDPEREVRALQMFRAAMDGPISNSPNVAS